MALCLTQLPTALPPPPLGQAGQETQPQQRLPAEHLQGPSVRPEADGDIQGRTEVWGPFLRTPISLTLHVVWNSVRFLGLQCLPHQSAGLLVGSAFIC